MPWSSSEEEKTLVQGSRVDQPIIDRLPMIKHLCISSSYVLQFEWFKMLWECYLKYVGCSLNVELQRQVMATLDKNYGCEWVFQWAQKQKRKSSFGKVVVPAVSKPRSACYLSFNDFKSTMRIMEKYDKFFKIWDLYHNAPIWVFFW